MELALPTTHNFASLSILFAFIYAIYNKQTIIIVFMVICILCYAAYECIPSRLAPKVQNALSELDNLCKTLGWMFDYVGPFASILPNNEERLAQRRVNELCSSVVLQAYEAQGRVPRYSEPAAQVLGLFTGTSFRLGLALIRLRLATGDVEYLLQTFEIRTGLPRQSPPGA